MSSLLSMYSLERREERGRPMSSAKSSSSTPPAGMPLARSYRSCSLMVDSSSKRNSSSPPSTPFTSVVGDATDTKDGDAADPGDESLLLLQDNFKLNTNKFDHLLY